MDDKKLRCLLSELKAEMRTQGHKKKSHRTDSADYKWHDGVEFGIHLSTMHIEENIQSKSKKPMRIKTIAE